MCETAERAPDFGTADLVGDHRLAGRKGAGHRPLECLRLAQAFEIEGNDARCRIVNQIIDEVRDLQVALVARGDQLGKSDAECVGAGQ